MKKKEKHDNWFLVNLLEHSVKVNNLQRMSDFCYHDEDPVFSSIITSDLFYILKAN